MGQNGSMFLDQHENTGSMFPIPFYSNLVKKNDRITTLLYTKLLFILILQNLRCMCFPYMKVRKKIQNYLVISKVNVGNTPKRTRKCVAKKINFAMFI
jgi:hypothetical protein